MPLTRRGFLGSLIAALAVPVLTPAFKMLEKIPLPPPLPPPVLDEEMFAKFAFPIIRNVYPNLVASELVSVQPMQPPTSLVFFFDSPGTYL